MSVWLIKYGFRRNWTKIWFLYLNFTSNREHRCSQCNYNIYKKYSNWFESLTMINIFNYTLES